MVLNAKERHYVQDEIKKDVNMLTQAINRERANASPSWKHQYRTQNLTLSSALELQRMMHNVLTFNDVVRIIMYYKDIKASLLIDNNNQNDLLNDISDNDHTANIKPTLRDTFNETLREFNQSNKLIDYFTQRISNLDNIVKKEW